ncbi:MAG: xylulokinase [Candidatus Cryptobacteroides sp.]
MYLLGYDVGSSSVKASLVDAQSGACVSSAFYPKAEALISAPKSGWAEQDPQQWWESLVLATKDVLVSSAVDPSSVKAIGISYQMHGLVCVDRDMNVLRPSIIWCDSRAVDCGKRAFEDIGEGKCLEHLLNSPGNFTASKLAWVKENEPDVYEKIYKVMLPGDYVAMKLTGEICTTVSGLSEGMFWDFKEGGIAGFLLDYYGIDASLLAPVRPTFSCQGLLCPEAAALLGLKEGTPVTYRAGDQPNNALSLNVFNPGEIASTAGTSGVVYGVNGKVAHDPESRVNIFAHVNHTQEDPRLGVLLCINGTGILNAWIRRNLAPEGLSYAQMNALASKVRPGSDGVSILPFGNGSERMLGNANPGCSVHGINFNVHSREHLMRAAQEGIVFSFCHGIGIMEDMGLSVKKIHAGMANMFLSDVFRQTLANVTGAEISLYDTDGAAGAAKGAGIGAGIYSGPDEAFASLRKVGSVEPDLAGRQACLEAYDRWLGYLGTKKN